MPTLSRKSKYPLLAIFGLLVIAGVVVHARRDTLIGQWQAKDRNASGAPEIITLCYLAGGRMTLQSQATQGTLVQSKGGIPAQLFPAISRAQMKASYTLHGDVMKVQTTEMRLLDAQGRQVTLPGVPKFTRTVYHYQIQGNTLTLDQLNGTPPTVLTRQGV